jgi:hypothetical protein
MLIRVYFKCSAEAEKSQTKMCVLWFEFVFFLFMLVHFIQKIEKILKLKKKIYNKTNFFLLEPLYLIWSVEKFEKKNSKHLKNHENLLFM